MNPSEVLEVRSRTFLRVWAFLATGGFGIIGIWLFSEALTFESNYTLFLFLGGLLGMVYGSISFLMILPAFTKRGNVIFRIQRGKNGAVLHRERTIPFQDIQSIDMRRHRYSVRGFLFMDVLIRKIDGKLIKIPAYSILDEEVFEQTVKQEIYPYLNQTAQADWRQQHGQVEEQIN
ncbi:YfjD family protein [Bacillus pumilus]|uniref:YfjD family protein n=1 Tax=Bacillus pumilus TaxID=1408 RepID=UPI0011A96866|nr:YfjD family protein [Bacillus pumilus]